MLTGEWRKSSRSGSNTNGQCVEARQVSGLSRIWRKSSRSLGNDNSACVEARHLNRVIQIRDSKLGEGSPILSASTADWRGFLSAVSK
jgi:hypothetical protein